MRGGDIFMGAFNAEQVMYNHFGYRTPIAGLYYAGSAAHPGGAISGGPGYISAGIIARDLGLETWWKPWDAREALAGLAAGCVIRPVNQSERKPCTINIAGHYNAGSIVRACRSAARTVLVGPLECDRV